MQGDTAISVMDCDKPGRLKILRRDAVTAPGCNICPFSCSLSVFCKEKSSFYKSFEIKIKNFNDGGNDDSIFFLSYRTAKYQQDTFFIMPFEGTAVFKDEGEEKQSLISGLKRTLIKGRYLDQTEMA